MKDLVDQGVDQLILYFSGHGLWLKGYEVWLLSDAPETPFAAISVTSCIASARNGSTPHVVIFSDACRVPARTMLEHGLEPVSFFLIESRTAEEL